MYVSTYHDLRQVFCKEIYLKYIFKLQIFGYMQFSLAHEVSTVKLKIAPMTGNDLIGCFSKCRQ